MFEAHREKKAEKAYEAALARWTEQRAEYAALLEVATSFEGDETDEILLRNGERLFFEVTGASLVEERRGPGHYEGASSGLSIPVATIGGRSVRYRVGASRGHYVAGTPSPTAVDTGTVFLTNERVVFTGSSSTRECAFSKLIGVHHDDAEGTSSFAVSNRQKPMVVHYGPKVSAAFDFRTDLALAHYRGSVDDLVGHLRTELDGIDRARPTPPAPVGT